MCEIFGSNLNTGGSSIPSNHDNLHLIVAKNCVRYGKPGIQTSFVGLTYLDGTPRLVLKSMASYLQ